AHSSGSNRSNSGKSALSNIIRDASGLRRESSADLWALNQFQAVAGWIDRDANHDAGVSKRARFAGHRATSGLDGSLGGLHIFHVKDEVRNRILQCVGIAMRDYDGRAF